MVARLGFLLVCSLFLGMVGGCTSGHPRSPNPTTPHGHGVHAVTGILVADIKIMPGTNGETVHVLIRPMGAVGRGGTKLTVETGREFRRMLLIGDYVISVRVSGTRCQQTLTISRNKVTRLVVHC